jgi:2'-5' RNA ligase
MPAGTWMRLFIAVDIDASVRRELEAVQRRLRQNLSGRGFKWVHPDLIHLTLKFLGEVPDASVPQVCQVARETAARHGAFELRVQGLGTFGRPPRVFWAGVQISEALSLLQEDLERSFENAGWPREEKSFSGHLTLARLQDPKAGSEIARFVQQQPSSVFGDVWVNELIVYESQLSSKGPVYTPVGRYDLIG